MPAKKPTKRKKAVTNQPFTIVDKKPRKVLGEGRNYGIGFALAKRKGTELHLVGPISPCREYLNDQIGAEISKTDVYACGYHATPSGLYEDDMMYLIMGVMDKKYGSTFNSYGAKQPKETEHLAAHYDKIQNFLNFVEEKLKLPDKTTIYKLEDNRFACVMPKYWGKTTWLISLYSLMIRVALEGFYLEGDPLEFFKNSKNTDGGIVGSVHPKIIALIEGCPIEPQDATGGVYWHGLGIYNQPLSGVKEAV